MLKIIHWIGTVSFAIICDALLIVQLKLPASISFWKKSVYVTWGKSKLYWIECPKEGACRVNYALCNKTILITIWYDVNCLLKIKEKHRLYLSSIKVTWQIVQSIILIWVKELAHFISQHRSALWRWELDHWCAFFTLCNICFPYCSPRIFLKPLDFAGC